MATSGRLARALVFCLVVMCVATLFALSTGYQPIDYVQALRVEEAKQMLETGALGVDEIAEVVGYGDPASFRRLFKRRAGLTPAAYRRKFRGIATIGAV